MLKKFTNVAVSILGTVATSMATLPTPGLTNTIDDMASYLPPLPEIQETRTKEVVEPKEKPKPKTKRLVCKGCNANEIRTVEFLQEKGIKDRNAIATIMGNIRQESTFHPNICEGGSRVPYRACRSGGFGIIQWTNPPRYYGLGNFAAKYGGNPSLLDTQLQYMMYEGDWRMIEPYMRTPGKSIPQYMRLAQKWIRWGHTGARVDYAYDYSKRIVEIES